MTQTHVSMGVAKTVLEVADVAWTAVQRCQHHRHHHVTEPLFPGSEGKGCSDMESLRSENQRLRFLLETNLTLLQQMSASPALLQECPSDLHKRLLAAVNSESFLNELENLLEKSKDVASCKFPFEAPSDSDLEKVEVLITVDQEETSWWVWVSEDMVSTNAEEKSGIDNENYIVVGEEHVVHGVANFMARCIVANPKALNLTPQELLKALTKALGDINKVEKMRNIWHAGKMFYTMATWGLTLARYILNILNRVAQILTGSSFLQLVPRPDNLETCCSWGSSFEQMGLESTLKRARQNKGSQHGGDDHSEWRECSHKHGPSYLVHHSLQQPEAVSQNQPPKLSSGVPLLQPPLHLPKSPSNKSKS